MAVFKDSKQFYECVGELMNRAAKDPNVGPKIGKSGSIIQFKYSEPEAMTTINARDKATQPGCFIDVFHGPSNLAPDIVMSMKADVAHRFWFGKVNLLAALTRREMVAKGPIPKVLKLLPVIKPAYDLYPKYLQENGFGDLML